MIVAIDIETQGISSKPDPFTDTILLVSVVIDDGREFIFEKTVMPDWVLSVVQNPSVLKLAHNASFEASFFQQTFGVRWVNVWDTLAIERLLTAGKGLPCDLASVAWRRLGRVLDKTIRSNFSLGIVGDKEREYCLTDARVLLPIYRQQVEEVKRNNQSEAARLENGLSPIIANMELVGIGFDQDLWYQYLPLLIKRRADCEVAVWEKLGQPYSYDLFEDRAIGGIPLTCTDKILRALKTIGISLNDYRSETIQDAYIRTANPVLKHLLDFKKWDKALSWNYPQYVHPRTGRIHASFNAQGADTFRFTLDAPNLDQVTKPFEDINFRHLFRAAPGNKIIGADYGQIELRILADETGEDRYLRAFNDGADMHQEVADLVLGRKATKAERNGIGKTINFGVAAYKGSHYVIMGAVLDYGFRVSEREAKEYVQRIRAANPKVEAWGKQQYEAMCATGFIQTRCGHRRWFDTSDVTALKETVARNTTIQMTAAGILKEAMLGVHSSLSSAFGDKANLILPVHDELIVEGPAEHAEAIREILVSKMVKAGEKWMKRVPTVVDSYISDTWEK